MSRVKVKICGIRTLEEAEASIEAGADALGFNFWPKSSRFITPEDARKIVERIPRSFAVGVFVNEDKSRIIEIASGVGLNAVQLHGDESPEFCSALGEVKTIKALRVDREFDVELIKKYPVNAVLLDTAIKGSYGGTGKSFDWAIAREAKRFARIILAGGLTVENVARAILEVRPSAVDVCSGVESAPGRKDLNKLRELLNEVARANALISDDERKGEREVIPIF
jgi:phosphoribosylanthranilate isomerase